MKMLPVQLSLNPPLGLWSDVLWRCPPAPPSQLAELKTQLPASLPSDPRLWGREDVTVFLRFCEREFDLPKVDHDLFQMNGKALCLLTRADFGHRCPGAGDVLHNVLQMLIIESHMMHWHLPNSPVTPTSRYPLSPHSHPPTPTWPPIVPPESPFHNSHMHHFMPPNSVTLSPPPSVDSQASSPPQGQEQNANSSNGSSSSGNASNRNSNNNQNGSVFIQNNTTSSSSNQSDSDDETFSEAKAASRAASAVAAAAAVAQYNSNNSPPPTPVLKDMSPSLTHQITSSFVNSWSQNQSNQKMHGASGSTSNGGSTSAPTTPSYLPVKREFFPENSEPNTNGRLLWDFLQQLLNDRNQKYSDLIAWKCRDTGVFKIVDPAGLAKLWGIQKNHLSMNYDKMSRALRYYYRVNILRKVQGERHCYQFLRNPTELKNIKNISLLRQSVANSSSTGNGSTAGNVQTPANSGSSNWQMPSQNGQGQSVQQQQQQQQQHQQQQQQQTVSQPSQSPQRPSSRSNNQLGIPGALPSASAISPSAAAAVAAAAAAYGPPPTSPLFMHAINGAFHYLTSNNQQQQQQQQQQLQHQQPPNSPALPTTPSEKLQFNSIKLESNSQDGEEMKPTDLSVSSGHSSSSEKRSYAQSSNSDCYPLIRNADGLTTIKLIRYNENSSPESPSHKQQCHDSSEDMQTSSMQTDNGSEASNYDGNMPTDLRK